ncbi:MAG TPA: AMP nucleosidase [Chlamydiales bacterium]|nr:AMP nucleosidase [Chlamydiales bacterium]
MERKEEEARVALETLERYSGCEASKFCQNIILTNFPKYVTYFASHRSVEVYEGSMFKVAHCMDEDISILDFKIGSPAAALVIDVLSFLPIKTAIFLGMCGGLRKRYNVGEYLVPVAAIRGEGTSDYYFPSYVPALANFLMQKAVTNILELEKSLYHVGISFTTNRRFWEFNDQFIEKLKRSKAQAIEMECATLFTASYAKKFTLGSLLLISDLPLKKDGVKTKSSSEFVFDQYTADHVEKGIRILKAARDMVDQKVKGYYHSEEEDQEK